MVGKLRWTTSRLVFRIVALGILIAGIGAVIRLGVILPLVRDDIQELMAAQQFSVASYVAQDIDQKIRERQTRLQRLVQSMPDSAAALPAWLRERQSINPVFSLGMLVLDSKGQVIAQAGSLQAAPKGYAQRDWFKAAVTTGAPAIGSPAMESNEPALVLAIPAHKHGESWVLAGVTALDTPGFLDGVQQNKVGEHGGFLLISPRDKLFVTGTDKFQTLAPTPPPGINLLHDRAMEGYRGTGITRNAQGREELSAMVSVPSAGWFLVARVPTSEAFQAVDRMYKLMLRVTIATVALLSIVILLILRFLFRPLSTAAQQVRDMVDGKQPLRPLPVVRPDEVGDLTTGFNSLLVKLQEREAALARLAHHDPLTGLPNRAAFLDRLEQAMALARRQHSHLALLFIDLDRFKPVNDSLGHDAGDQLLQEVALRLRNSIRQTDLVGRIGGDEFLVLLSDVDSRESVTRVAQKCIEAMATPFHLGDDTVAIGASIGIALFPDHGASSTELITRADAAMYDAKNEGRNTYRLAGPTHNIQ